MCGLYDSTQIRVCKMQVSIMHVLNKYKLNKLTFNGTFGPSNIPLKGKPYKVNCGNTFTNLDYLFKYDVSRPQVIIEIIYTGFNDTPVRTRRYKVVRH